MVAYRRPLRRRPRNARRPAWSKYKFALAKKAVSTAGRLYRAYRARPSRLRVSSTRTANASQVTRAIRNVSGSKYTGYTKECQDIVNKPAGTQPINYIFMNTSKDITSLGGSLVNYTPMNLFKYPQGTGNDERVGDYMFLRNTKLKLEIQALPLDSISRQPVLQFRLMVVKANRKYDSYGSFFDPGNSLFLDTQNGPFGYGVPAGTSTSSTFLNMDALINKREWLVYCDKRFNLSAPAINDASNDVNNANSHFKTKKYVTLNLPSNKKCHFKNSATANNNVPQDFDSQWLLILQCVNGSYCADGTAAPRNFTMNVIGSTCAYDN